MLLSVEILLSDLGGSGASNLRSGHLSAVDVGIPKKSSQTVKFVTEQSDQREIERKNQDAPLSALIPRVDSTDHINSDSWSFYVLHLCSPRSIAKDILEAHLNSSFLGLKESSAKTLIWSEQASLLLHSASLILCELGMWKLLKASRHLFITNLVPLHTRSPLYISHNGWSSLFLFSNSPSLFSDFVFVGLFCSLVFFSFFLPIYSSLSKVVEFYMYIGLMKYFRFPYLIFFSLWS